MAKPKEIEKGKWKLDSRYKGLRKTFRGKTSNEVKKKEREWQREIDDYGSEIKKGKHLLNELMKEYLLTTVKPTVSLGTFERYMSIYNTHYKNVKFGNEDIKNITAADAKAFINSKNELSTKSMSLIKALLYNTLEYAIEQNIIRQNVASKLKLPKSKVAKRNVDAMTLDQQQMFLNIIKGTYYELLFIFALNTGMRVGEITALKWENIDFNTKMINVSETTRLVTIYDDDGTAIENKLNTDVTKTTNSTRKIPMSNELAILLKKHKLASKNKQYVFVNTKNEQIKYDSISKSFKLVCEKSCIGSFTFHCLRHTFATRCIEMGVDVKTVSELLGHANVKMTLDKYVTSTTETKVKAIEQMSNLIIIM